LGTDYCLLYCATDLFKHLGREELWIENFFTSYLFLSKAKKKSTCILKKQLFLL
jgi:hypothetical protein